MQVVLAMTSALRPRGSTRRWRRIRQAIIDRDGGVCQICGQPGGVLDVDHIVRRVDGGTDDPANLRAAHHVCSFVPRAGRINTSRIW